MDEAHFLRVAHPLEQWDDSRSADELAKELASEASWSLFVRIDGLDPVTVLGAYYGWRKGRGPLHDHGYLLFAESELKLSQGTLIRSPDHFTFGWPPEVRDAHYDLEGHTLAGARAFVSAVMPFRARLRMVARLDVLAAQVALRDRADVPSDFQLRVDERLRKLAIAEPDHWATLKSRCEAHGSTL